MIVRNEQRIITRCLESVAAYIDCWVIGGTGSSDGTPETIETFFRDRGIPGELHYFPFVNFEQARNEALVRARASALSFDYLLLTDAMELEVADPSLRDRLFVRTVAERWRTWETLIAPALRRPPLAPILAAFPGEVRPGLMEQANAWDARRG